MRYVDIVSFHDGTDGPAGAPRTCIEHNGARALERGEVRMTLEQYRETRKTWDEDYARWLESNPLPMPRPIAFLPDVLPAWACKAALDEAGMLGSLKAALADAELATRWRFESATTWHRADIEAIGDRFGVRAAARERLWARAAEIAQV